MIEIKDFQEINADQMIISVGEYNRFRAARKQFNIEKEKHIKENLVCTVSYHLRGGSWDSWEKEEKVYKRKYEAEYNKKFKSMSVFAFIKWKRNH